jgi:hypothetical protein
MEALPPIAEIVRVLLQDLDQDFPYTAAELGAVELLRKWLAAQEAE